MLLYFCDKQAANETQTNSSIGDKCIFICFHLEPFQTETLRTTILYKSNSSISSHTNKLHGVIKCDQTAVSSWQREPADTLESVKHGGPDGCIFY